MRVPIKVQTSFYSFGNFGITADLLSLVRMRMCMVLQSNQPYTPPSVHERQADHLPGPLRDIGAGFQYSSKKEVLEEMSDAGP